MLLQFEVHNDNYYIVNDLCCEKDFIRHFPVLEFEQSKTIQERQQVAMRQEESDC